VIEEIRNIRFTYQSAFAILVPDQKLLEEATRTAPQRYSTARFQSEGALMAMPEPRTKTTRRANVARWVKGLMVIWRHWRDVEVLASFDDHMLADIGLTRADLYDAIAEPRWRDPTTLLDLRRHERLVRRHEAVVSLAGQNVDSTAFRRHPGGCGRPVARPLLTG
jgi:uncharacterized protein YjiS (DUF1127 family)